MNPPLLPAGVRRPQNDFLRRREALIAAVQDGLPLVPEPWAALAATLGWSESEVRDGLAALLADGTVRRLGVIVRHRELGFAANAMVVWDVPQARVDALGALLAAEPAVTLCYRRPRVPPHWPYNLFCMIHGHDRAAVLAELAAIVERHGLGELPHRPLFSRQRFKQRGARYIEGGARP